MREIKFRAWDSAEGKMLEGAVMVFTHTTGTSVLFNWKHLQISYAPGMNWRKDDYGNFYSDDGSVSPMQFTGLKDKNGVEIYEGDVIKAKHDDGHYDVGEVVYGRKGSFCISLPEVATGIKSPLLNYIHGIMFDESDIEVIGNIHENPDLLKQE